MKFLRFIFPFIFVRNWHDGSWEISRARLILTLACAALIIIGLAIVYILQAPVAYTTEYV